MKAATDARLPRPLRDGMVHALTDCLERLDDHGGAVSALYEHIHSQLRALRTEEYEEYCRRWLLYKGPVMSFKQWREAVADLHEAIELAAMFEQEPGPKAAELRRRLLLNKDELPALHGDRADRETQERDGRLDGYWEIEEIFEEAESLDVCLGPKELCVRISQLIFAAWPSDYLDYYKRYMALYRKAQFPAGVGSAMDYDEWCSCVDALHALAARCEEQGRAPESSRKYRNMLVRLLRVPGESAPVVD